METLPKDPYMLLSFVNMKLRDYYDSFDSMCDDIGVSPYEIEKVLNEAGFFYDSANNRFV